MASVPGWQRRAADWCFRVGAQKAASVWSYDVRGSPCTRVSFATTPTTDKRTFRLRPAQRLRQKREFDGVYARARRSSDALFTVLARENGGPGPRLGLAIAVRAVGNSVQRNRVKRLVRDSFRRCQHDLPAVDIVVNARNAVRTAANHAILHSLARHWQNIANACARS